MQLKGKYRIVIEGDTDVFDQGGADPRLIGYLMQRLMCGHEAHMPELKYWNITVRCEEGEVSS
ncbi:hypothetical protein SZ64_04290 [Erythrobacter sp. SG61-1L]|uniref:hypothetical protein n=1 Tax=Erythrobacter sp. SG61-1L TaxID=1603897 RepID=UPI0006C8F2E8|nr:hypothetical protein [Erythrobacter sp. SG61-1L]KPL67391.1 hypothetical protein SZ64_04290 [Erythrobacter sp. SG61-1L]